MTSLMALVVGVLYAAAIYMMLRRSIVKLVIGLVLLQRVNDPKGRSTAP